MKTHKCIAALALVTAAFTASVQATHLQQAWNTELSKTPRQDTTYNMLAEHIKKDALDADQINKLYQDPSADNIRNFQIKRKNDVTGVTNGKITQLRQSHQRVKSFVHGRLKEIASAQTRLHNAIKKSKAYIQNKAQDITDQTQEASEALAKDNPDFEAKVQKKSETAAKADAKTAAAAQKIENRKQAKKDQRNAAKARFAQAKSLKETQLYNKRSNSVLVKKSSTDTTDETENKYNNHF